MDQLPRVTQSVPPTKKPVFENRFDAFCLRIYRISMSAVTAKVFRSGNSQALRLPKAFRLKSSTVTLVKTADGFYVQDELGQASRIKAFRALGGSCPDFPDVSRNEAANLKRDWE